MVARMVTLSSPFTEDERRGVYRAIYERRDVRSDFLPDPVPDEVLHRILDAAHHAPSVGFMQPWDFIVIRDASVRQAVHRNFEIASRRAAEKYQGEQRKLYDSLKLAGILEAPVNICVTCDHGRSKGNGLGRQTAPSVDLYSTVCAVQNLWFAARAESLGVGWVSILDYDELRLRARNTAGVDARRVSLRRLHSRVSFATGARGKRLGEPRESRQPDSLRPLGRRKRKG